jgi:hypothetical protein
MINAEITQLDRIEQNMIVENVKKYGIENTLNSVNLK